MQKIKVRKISEGEIREVFKRLLRDHSDEFLRRFFEDAFQCEFDRIVSPENERSYYVVSVNGIHEALFGIRENSSQPQIWNVSSFGRIIEKDKAEGKGWQYLKALLDFAVREGVNRINATVNDAGEKAFKELESNGGLPENWGIECSPCGSLRSVVLRLKWGKGDANS
jgi:hypothetical protein